MNGVNYEWADIALSYHKTGLSANINSGWNTIDRKVKFQWVRQNHTDKNPNLTVAEQNTAKNILAGRKSTKAKKAIWVLSQLLKHFDVPERKLADAETLRKRIEFLKIHAGFGKRNQQLTSYESILFPRLGKTALKLLPEDEEAFASFLSKGGKSISKKKSSSHQVRPILRIKGPLRIRRKAIQKTSQRINKVLRKCNEGKEHHPITHRCVNKCREGQHRTPLKGKCFASCAAGKARNPLTDRCVKTDKETRRKPCAKGKVRNVSGKCIKDCVRSAKTGRCILDKVAAM